MHPYWSLKVSHPEGPVGVPAFVGEACGSPKEMGSRYQRYQEHMKQELQRGRHDAPNSTRLSLKISCKSSLQPLYINSRLARQVGDSQQRNDGMFTMLWNKRPLERLVSDKPLIISNYWKIMPHKKYIRWTNLFLLDLIDAPDHDIWIDCQTSLECYLRHCTYLVLFLFNFLVLAP